MKGKRSTREEAMKLEDQVLRLASRSLSYREIGVALNLSESEVRRKHDLALARRKEEVAGVEAYERLRAGLAEVLRTAYRDHDDAPAGSPQRVGFLKLIVEVFTRMARLDGWELEKPNLALLAPVGRGDDSHPSLAIDLQPLLREAGEALEARAREVIELGLSAGKEDVHLPQESGGVAAAREES